MTYMRTIINPYARRKKQKEFILDASTELRYPYEQARALMCFSVNEMKTSLGFVCIELLSTYSNTKRTTNHAWAIQL